MPQYIEFEMQGNGYVTHHVGNFCEQKQAGFAALEEASMTVAQL